MIGKSTGDYDLKKTIRKSDVSIEAITEALHEYMHEKLNDSPETEEEKKIRYLSIRKTKGTKELSEKPTKFKKLDRNRCRAPNWTRQHECPGKGKKCAKCEKIGHNAKYCRTNKRINHIQDDVASSADDDDLSPNTIHSVNQEVHSTCQIKRNGPEFFTITALINRPIKFIIDSCSPVTLIPKSQFNGTTPLRPVGTEYRDVNDNRIKFEGKTTASVEINNKRNNLEILITTKKTNPLLGLDWIEKLDTGNIGPQINNITEDPDITTLKRRFKKLFNENYTVNGSEVKILLKDDGKLIQQKGRPIPIHLQQSVGKERNKLMRQAHIEKTNNIDGNCFVIPAVVTVKKDKLVKIPLDSRKLNEITIKKRSNGEHGRINLQNFQKNRGRPSNEIWTSKLDLDYAYGQLILSKEAQNICIFAVTGGDFTGYHRFLKRFYGLADIPTIFQEKIGQTLENEHPAWLDDIIIVTKGSKGQHKKELIEALTRLENAGYRLSGNKSEFFKPEIEWIGHKIDQIRIRPLQDKLAAIKKPETTQQRKGTKIVLGGNSISV